MLFGFILGALATKVLYDVFNNSQD